jgi:hypothetical protein
MLYCNEPIPAFEQDICANEEGRIIAIAYLREDHAIANPAAKADWDAAIANGTAIVIQNVRGSKPVGSPVTADGFGRQKTKTTSYDRSLAYQHPDVIGNEDFYNTLNFDNSHLVAYYTAGRKIWMPPTTEAPIADINADPAIEDPIDSTIVFDVQVGWAAKNMHTAYDAPSGIFE